MDYLNYEGLKYYHKKLLTDIEANYTYSSGENIVIDDNTISVQLNNITEEEIDALGFDLNPKKYTIDLNNQWRLGTVSNPDASLYDGVYESYSNKGVDNSIAKMYIDIKGYKTFSFYIRSNAESGYDYVTVSQLDEDITLSQGTTGVYAHTQYSQNSSTSLTSYKLVTFTGIDKGAHRITIAYRKDSSASGGSDQGYVLIPKNQ